MGSLQIIKAELLNMTPSVEGIPSVGYAFQGTEGEAPCPYYLRPT